MPRPVIANEIDYLTVGPDLGADLDHAADVKCVVYKLFDDQSA